MRELADLARRVASIERRIANFMREGTVQEVDAAEKRVRLRLGGSDAAPFLSPWIPYSQHAGALKIHAPPSVGQQMTLLSPTGDLRRGQAFPFTWSDAEPSPSDAPDQNVLTFGDLRLEVLADALRVTLGELVFELKSDAVRIQLGGSEVTIDAGQVLLKSEKVVTDGETRLDNGDRAVVYSGSKDSSGDTNIQGAGRVYV